MTQNKWYFRVVAVWGDVVAQGGCIDLFELVYRLVELLVVWMAVFFEGVKGCEYIGAGEGTVVVEACVFS